jgi:hypothetical protein
MLLETGCGVAGGKPAGRESESAFRLLAGVEIIAARGIARHRFRRRNPARVADGRGPRLEFDSMKKTKNKLSAELLILPDGRVLVQNLTQPMAEILRKLNPRDRQIAPRAFPRHASRITHHAP